MKKELFGDKTHKRRNGLLFRIKVIKNHFQKTRGTKRALRTWKSFLKMKIEEGDEVIICPRVLKNHNDYFKVHRRRDLLIGWEILLPLCWPLSQNHSTCSWINGIDLKFRSQISHLAKVIGLICDHQRSNFLSESKNHWITIKAWSIERALNYRSRCHITWKPSVSLCWVSDQKSKSQARIGTFPKPSPFLLHSHSFIFGGISLTSYLPYSLQYD